MSNQPVRNEVHILGRNIAAYRKRSSLRQDELGQLVDVTGSTISVYEAGKNHYINMDLVHRIANIFDVTVDDLFADTQVLADPIGKWNNKKHASPGNDTQEPVLLKAELTYSYTIGVGDRKYTVLSKRNVTPGGPQMPFNMSCYGQEGLPLPEGQLTGMLKSKVFEVINQMKDRKRDGNGER